MPAKPKPVRIVAPVTTGELAVRLVRGPGLFSHLISWWGGPYDGYSHADIRMPDGRWLGARSDRISGPPGVQIRPADYGVWQRQTLFTRSVSVDEQARWLAAAQAKIGTAYDRAGILRLILGEKPVADGKDFCSCLVIVVGQEIGRIPRELTQAPEDVSPNGLGLGLSMGGWAMTEIPV